MSRNYNLSNIEELASGDQEFINAIVVTFLEEIPEDLENLKKAFIANDFNGVYQNAHKIKPTVDMFGLGIMEEIIVVQEWGRLKKSKEDISSFVDIVSNKINTVKEELIKDFQL